MGHVWSTRRARKLEIARGDKLCKEENSKRKRECVACDRHGVPRIPASQSLFILGAKGGNLISGDF